MHTAARKLHSQRGASMLFAMLVFLLCLLAGVAALTAAAANAGRYTHVEGEQQQYYSVASALELLQAQLDAAADPVATPPGALTVKVKYTKTQEWQYVVDSYTAAGDPVYRLDPKGDPTYKLELDPATPPTSLNYLQYLLLKNCVPPDWWENAEKTPGSFVDTAHQTPSDDTAYTVKPYFTSAGDAPAWAASLWPVDVTVTAQADSFTLKMTLTPQNGSAYKLNAVWSGVPVTETDTTTETTGILNGSPPAPPATGSYDSTGTRTTTTYLTCSLRLSAENREVTFG